ncbi:DNA-processing protein DprA [Frankia sp. AiPs1]|uniref:DNA-processing protein DprA n=1 Tax=Frankia sp. AiPs1 TaxID=573493 RepID=UPI002043DF0B|nr:DNA-processing protein DprA [Frankia sp. AiPs1]MCM3922398.1 DNA-processing protein DprA [Frankia sp. AiPs1]
MGGMTAPVTPSGQPEPGTDLPGPGVAPLRSAVSGAGLGVPSPEQGGGEPTEGVIPMTAVPGGEVETDPERLARVALTRVFGPEHQRVAVEVGRHGAARVWAEVRSAHPGVDPQRDLEAASRVGARLVCPQDAEWPIELDALDRLRDEGDGSAIGAPLCLWVRGPGDLRELASRAVALVGCRAATSYGLHLAGEIAFAMAEQGWAVVSGAAFGIDAAAHRGALAAAGPTVAVLAGGVDVPYPAAHVELLAEIARTGAVVSEVSPGTPPFRRRFLTRNRVIAALCRGTVLVEAGPRSGALNTVAHARRLGRQVMVVPGPVTSAMSVGCHRLLRDFREQTVLVTGAEDISEEIAAVGRFAARPPKAAGPRDGLSAMVRDLLDAMPSRAAIGVSVLSQRTGLRPEEVLAMLGPLTVEGLIESVPNGYRLTPLGRAPSNAGSRSRRS